MGMAEPAKPVAPGSRSSRFEWLDLARLFAIGMVILYHFGWRGATRTTI